MYATMGLPIVKQRDEGEIGGVVVNETSDCQTSIQIPVGIPASSRIDKIMSQCPVILYRIWI
jgi:hypothetical protein